MEKYYRYHEVLYSDNKIIIVLTEFPVLKHTPKGVWIEEFHGKKRFVLKDAHKKFAAATKEEALESFRARKKRQMRILETRLKIAKVASEADPNDPFIYY